MKVDAIRLMAVLTAMGAIVLPSCTKQYEYLENGLDEIGQYCKLDSLVRAPTNAVVIYYNKDGNPVEFTPAFPNPDPGDPDFHFRYDKFGRLKDALLTQPGQSFVFIWQRFFYPGPHMAGDSIFEYDGELSDPNPPTTSEAFEYVYTYSLDAKGRTFKTTFSANPFRQESKDTFYTEYDKNGNQVAPGVTYDNKISIYRTSSVWQLLYQNYSMNNSITPASGPIPPSITSYNRFGLPATYLNLQGQPGIFGLNYGPLDVKYSCDSKPAPPGYPATGNTTGKE